MFYYRPPAADQPACPTPTRSKVRAMNQDSPSLSTQEQWGGTHGEAAPSLLSLRGIVKSFVGVRVLDQVDFDLRAGEVHVLFGENGAGKSTLINIAAGALSCDEGILALQGETMRFHSVQDARRAGIAAVFQEFSLAPALSAEDNLLLGAEPRRGPFLDRAQIRSKAKEALDRLGFDLDGTQPVGLLSRAQRQMVEIAKALLTNPTVLILDEPTASLNHREAKQLFRIIQQMKADGIGIIYITHKLSEISEIGDRITVMRDGRSIKTLGATEVDQTTLVELMTGRRIGEFFPKLVHKPGAMVFEARQVTTADGKVRGASISVRSGEIVGLAGLAGCGKSELARSCFGLTNITSGKREFRGCPIDKEGPRHLLDRGMIYVSSDRGGEGILPGRSIRENITLHILPSGNLTASGFLQRKKEREIAESTIKELAVHPASLEKLAAEFSGGNQQKIVFSKAITRPATMLILDEPTVGIDVAAKADIYKLLVRLAESGVAVLLCSSDMAEIVNLCHRVYVVHNGAISTMVQADEINERNVLTGFFGNGGS